MSEKDPEADESTQSVMEKIRYPRYFISLVWYTASWLKTTTTTTTTTPTTTTITKQNKKCIYMYFFNSIHRQRNKILICFMQTICIITSLDHSLIACRQISEILNLTDSSFYSLNNREYLLKYIPHLKSTNSKT